MATDLGQLAYTLILNDEGFQGQLSSASAKVEESSGQMTGSLKGTEEQSGKTGGAFSGMAGQFVAGAAIFTIAQKGLSLLKDTLRDGVKNFEEWQQNQAQIANSLKVTNDASGQTTKSLNEYADALSNQTGITGNAINSAQLVMLNYKAIGKDIFPEATKQVANFATVLSHGAVPSQDEMNAAAKKLGTALEDPAKGMARLKIAGIVLTEDQQKQIKNMEKTGDLAGAQKQLLSDVADVIGGKASTAAHTLAGEQAKLHAEIEKVQIMIGQKLTAAFKAIEPYLAKFADFVMKHKVILVGFISAIGGLAVAIGVVLVAAIITFISTAGVAIGTLGIIIGAAVVVGVIAYEIISHWKDLKRWFSDFIRDLKQWFSDGIRFIKGIFSDVTGAISIAWKAVKDAAKVALDWINDRIQAVTGFLDKHKKAITDIAIVIGTILLPAFVKMAAQAAVSAATTVASLVTSFATASASAAVSAATTTSAWVVSAAKSIAAWIINLPKLIAEMAVTSAKAILNAAKITASFVASAVTTAASWAVSFALFAAGMAVMVAQFLIQAARMAVGWLLAMGPIGAIVAIVAGIVALIIANWGTVGKFLSGLWQDIKNLFTDGINFIKTHWALIVDIILGPLGIVITNVIQHWGAIKSGFLDAVNFVKNIWGTIVGFFEGIWRGISGAVGQVGTVLRGVFRDAFNAIIGLWDDTMGRLFHGQRIGIGPVHFDLPNLNIPRMATGGIVESATLALIGEAGPEAVIPLNKSNSPGMGATYNFQPGSVILSTKEAVDEFFSIGNRSTQLELAGGSPLAGTTGV